MGASEGTSKESKKKEQSHYDSSKTVAICQRNEGEKRSEMM
jgi:hypothetical protein